MSIKNSTDTIGNRTRDLPACSAVPQPTAQPHTPGLEIQWSCISTLLQGTIVNGARSFSRLGYRSLLASQGSARNRGINALKKNLNMHAKILQIPKYRSNFFSGSWQYCNNLSLFLVPFFQCSLDIFVSIGFSGFCEFLLLYL
jgi:hypothetical protein